MLPDRRHVRHRDFERVVSEAQRDIGIPPCPTTGVPPFGHSTQLRIFIDPDLLQFEEVWAAAGTWNDVFGIEPHRLVEASGGAVTDLKRG
jgi:prolyl-tRNA editing enzyme YbaK/EbsC (Cys-tRNA(Pro) deacylase)